MCRSLVIVGLLVTAVCGLPAKDNLQDDPVTEILPEMSDTEFRKFAESLGIPVDTLPTLSEADRALFAKISVENQKTPKAKEANRTTTEGSKDGLEMYKTWAERQINAQEEEYLEYKKWAEEQFDSMERKVEEMEKEKELREKIIGNIQKGEGNEGAEESRVKEMIRRNREKEREVEQERTRLKKVYESEIKSLEDKLKKAEDELLRQKLEQEEQEETIKQERQKREGLKKEHAEAILLKDMEVNKKQELLIQAEQQLSLQEQKCRMKVEEERKRMEEKLESDKKIAEGERQELQNRMSLVLESQIANLNRKQESLTRAEQELKEQSKKYEEEKRRSDELMKEVKKQEQQKREQLLVEHVKTIRMTEEKLEKTNQELAQKELENEQDRENWKRAEHVMREIMESEQRRHAGLLIDYDERIRKLQNERQELIRFTVACRKLKSF